MRWRDFLLWCGCPPEPPEDTRRYAPRQDLALAILRACVRGEECYGHDGPMVTDLCKLFSPVAASEPEIFDTVLQLRSDEMLSAHYHWHSTTHLGREYLKVHTKEGGG